jgi:hypothetical protein
MIRSIEDDERNDELSIPMAETRLRGSVHERPARRDRPTFIPLGLPTL